MWPTDSCIIAASAIHHTARWSGTKSWTLASRPLPNRGIFGRFDFTKMGAITDGTSNTVFFIEVKPELAVPWTAPDDYQSTATPASAIRASFVISGCPSPAAVAAMSLSFGSGIANRLRHCTAH